MAPDPQSRDTAAIAAHWVARREAGLTDAEKADLQDWLRADPRHRVALAAADPHASELDWPLHSGSLDRVLAGLEKRATQRRARRRRWLRRTGAAAALLMVGAIVSARWLTPEVSEAATLDSLVIRRPEVRPLPDGSVVELNADAEIRVAYDATARRIELVRGSAHFTVQKDATRPFLVAAGSVTARAVGTAFLVGIETSQVALVVTEGRVALDSAARASAPDLETTDTLALVRAGESVAIDRAGTSPEATPRITNLPAAEQQRRLAWRTPRLEFNGTPLHLILAVLNRHNRTQLRLGDPGLGELKLSGALSADRVDALLETIEADFGIVAEKSDTAIILRRRTR